MSANNNVDQICCPPFHPEEWEDKVFEWDNKMFIRSKVCTFFYMPLNFGQVMRKIDVKIKKAEAEIIDNMCLSDHISRFKMNVLMPVNKEIESLESEKLSGKFYCKVYEGPFSDTSKWCNDYKQAVQSKGFRIVKWYMWYTTCPKCAKKYGKNYTAIICKVE